MRSAALFGIGLKDLGRGAGEALPFPVSSLLAPEAIGVATAFWPLRKALNRPKPELDHAPLTLAVRCAKEKIRSREFT
jgi:hypothetical protein